LRGLEYANPSTQAANAQARQLFESAIALDPQYAAANALLGLTHRRDWLHQWSQDPQTLERAFALAQRAIALDPNDAQGYATLAEIVAFAGRPQVAFGLVEKALRLDPQQQVGNNLDEILIHRHRSQKPGAKRPRLFACGPVIDGPNSAWGSRQGLSGPRVAPQPY